MPFIGIGLHVLIALLFAVHVVRSGQNMYWLMILFLFPLLGSIVYFVAVYLPESRLRHTVRRSMVAAGRVLDPGRELREAQHAYDLTPTAQNQMRLASALLAAGAADQATAHYEACLRGPFASDPEIRLGAALARLRNDQGAAAIELLEAIRRDSAEYRPEQVALLLAQAYAHTGKDDAARREFLFAISRFGSFEARAQYALWAIENGDIAAAQDQYEDILKSMRHWSKHTQDLNRPLVRRLETAFSGTTAR